jgi:hypothetical protein
MDPDPDPALFVSGLQDADRKLCFFPKLFAQMLLHHSSQVKFKKKPQNSSNQGLSYQFC